MFYSCSKCGRIHKQGERCRAVKRIYNRTEADKLHNTNEWHKKAAQIKEDALHLCEVCRQEGIYNYKNLEVHHITKLREDPDGLLNDNNLICLCTRHHKEADAGILSADYLRELAAERIQGSGL